MSLLQRFRIPLTIIALLIAGLLIFTVLRPAPASQAISITPRPTTAATPTATTPSSLRVYVSGAVKHPDVYEVPIGSIVKDALTVAGGAIEETDLERINLAAALSDGMQVHFPRKGEAAVAPAPGGDPSVAVSGPINLNTATLEQLDTLSGIGPSIAQRIIDYRTANGPFASIEQIKDVKGIGDALFEKIKDSIIVTP